MDNNCQIVQIYVSSLNDNGFISLVNDSLTRINESSKSLLDHRHANIDCSKNVIFDVGLTDHCLLGWNVILFLILKGQIFV